MNRATMSLAEINSSRMPPELFLVFVSDTIIPSIEDSIILPPPPMMLKRSYTTRRYVFDASKAALLKEKAASATSIQQPTRVEAVAAFLWKCLIATSKPKPWSPRRSALLQAVNLRKKLQSPVPQNYVGNLSI
uniref:Uncharacterized protein n=1 Tax=Rhizophora mucronata TaxID=61149 RepID=A0A2P2M2K5_RHIMU